MRTAFSQPAVKMLCEQFLFMFSKCKKFNNCTQLSKLDLQKHTVVGFCIRAQAEKWLTHFSLGFVLYMRLTFSRFKNRVQTILDSGTQRVSPWKTGKHSNHKRDKRLLQMVKCKRKCNKINEIIGSNRETSINGIALHLWLVGLWKNLKFYVIFVRGFPS